MNIVVLMPLYKAMDAHCVISLIDFHQQLIADGHNLKFVFTNGFNAAKARRALSKFVGDCEDEYDYVLWLDSDHIYKKEDFYSLVKRIEKENIPMVSATYRLHGCSDTAHGITDEKGFRHYKQDELQGEELIDCQVVGFGFLLMKYKFMKELWNKHGLDLFVLDAKQNATEDVKFCRVVLDDGHRVCFDPQVRVGHIELAVRY